MHMAQLDRALLEAALVGYQIRRDEIAQAIAGLQERLGNKTNSPARVSEPSARGGKRTMSAEGRARIAEAQRKRWAAARKK